MCSRGYYCFFVVDDIGGGVFVCNWRSNSFGDRIGIGDSVSCSGDVAQVTLVRYISCLEPCAEKRHVLLSMHRSS